MAPKNTQKQQGGGSKGQPGGGALSTAVAQKKAVQVSSSAESSVKALLQVRTTHGQLFAAL